MSSTAEATADRKARRASWLLSLPALVVLLFAASGPLLIIVVYSFLSPGKYGNVDWVFSLDAWVGILYSRDIFDGTYKLADAHLTIFWRSVKLSLYTTAFTFVVGFPTAWFIATRSQRMRAILLFLITIPFWTNLLVRTFAINQIIRNEGVFNTLMIWMGFIDEPVQIIYTDFAVFLGMTYVYLPLMVLPLYATIDRFDMGLLEAAHDLYASRWQVLRTIVVPIVKPGIIAGSILVFIPSLGAYVTPRILGGGRNMMIGNFIELQFGAGRNWPLGAALSVTLLIACAAALLIYVRFANRENAHG
ncbi:Spermidine/putrescine transport system permease protein PotB (plasmid) [Pseudoseohaeicola sp. NH-UV-7]|uniref:ABC transporter permease n=1 Tax=Sulfitobacter sp. TBRI5 TaxID=2989732 RepID=UPI003A64CA1C